MLLCNKAYAILTEREPSALAALPPIPSGEEVARVAAEALTIGEERFAEAERLMREGKLSGAEKLFAELRTRYATTWIKRAAEERLGVLRKR